MVVIRRPVSYYVKNLRLLLLLYSHWEYFFFMRLPMYVLYAFARVSFVTPVPSIGYVYFISFYIDTKDIQIDPYHDNMNKIFLDGE